MTRTTLKLLRMVRPESCARMRKRVKRGIANEQAKQRLKSWLAQGNYGFDGRWQP